MTSALAQDPNAYLKAFENKVYSLKSKGVKDFVVDIESSKLSKDLNDQQIFGKVENVIFRVFWTAVPERMAIEIIGLPEGFKEIKEELKLNMIGNIENIIPMTFAQRFSGYKFVQGNKPKEILATDTTGISPVPSYLLKFDDQDRLVEIVANKPIGTTVYKPDYKKEAFADGRYALMSQFTESVEFGRSVKIEKEINYGKAQGIAVVSSVETTTEQKGLGKNTQSSSLTEEVLFRNYKINEGLAMKYFLGESKAP